MPITPTNNTEHFEFLKAAFDKDGFQVKNLKEDEMFDHIKYVKPQGYMEFQGKIGVLAEHKTAKNTVTGKAKRAYYIEGNNYQMGFLMGLLSESEVSRMTTDYIDKVIFDFFKSDLISKYAASFLGDMIQRLLIKIVIEKSQGMRPDIPDEYIEELDGLYDGCQAANVQSRVRFERLWALNFGIDCLLSHLYTGKIFTDQKVPAFLLNIPIMCNGFFLNGDVVTDKGHFYGRDFMFPPAGVFQDVACLVVYNPTRIMEGDTVQPIVSQTAPGIIGSIAVMNTSNVAAGIQMSPSMLCNPNRPGFNSMLLIRDAVHHSNTIDTFIDRIVEAPRGVSWLYTVADGKTGKNCTLETGCKIEGGSFPYLAFAPEGYKKHLPDEKYILNMRKKYNTPEPLKGLMPRWPDYNFPSDYVTDFNKGLWEHFDGDFLKQVSKSTQDIIGDLVEMLTFSKLRLTKLVAAVIRELKELFEDVKYDPAAFGEKGYINKTFKDNQCPGPYYFPPQREKHSDLLLLTNHFITPEMRLTCMSDWIATIASSFLNDIQWRYDELNFQLLTAIEEAVKNKKTIDMETAWKLLNFLEPSGKFPGYYNPGNKKKWQEVEVWGSISLFDMKNGIIRSRYGYYGDEPVSLTLSRYIAE